MPIFRDTISGLSSTPESPPIEQEARSTSSEIERFQYAFDSTNWVFYLFAITVVVSFFGAESSEDWICAITIEIAAFLSVFLWAKKAVLGMPIMPMYAIVCLVYYGLPFVTGHPVVLEYDFSEKWLAATTVAAVLFIMTLIWASLARPTPPREKVIRTLLPEKGAIGILLACLVAGIAFQSNVIYYTLLPSSEVYGVLRAIFLTLGLLSVFSLSYLLGAGSLNAGVRFLFIALAAIFIAFHAVSLYLITASQYLLVASFGYFLGSGRVPWKLMLAILAVLTVLQAGKGEIRFKYSEEGEAAYSSRSPLDLLEDWFGTGLTNLFLPKSARDRDPVPLVYRASLVQMLLKTQTEAPDRVAYLDGSTYLQIPLLLVPRIIWADRPNTSETLVQLNEHYGLLTRSEAESTSIGWGMIAEANANFGLLGCIGLAIVLGTALGWAQRSFGRFPVLSARGMAGLLVMSTVVSMEASMAQLLTILAQSFVPLLLLAFTVMRPSRVIV